MELVILSRNDRLYKWECDKETHRKPKEAMIVKYTYKFGLYPNKEQERFLNIQFGHYRFVYNKLLEIAQKEYKETGKQWNYYEYKKLLPQLKQEYQFLKEANSQSLQESVKNLDRAFKWFFKGQSGFPKFKKKKSTKVIHIQQAFYD